MIFVGCNDIRGEFNIAQNITLKDVDGKPISLTPGVYESELEFKSKKKIELDVNFNGKEFEIPFAIPKNFKLPKVKGNFVLKAKEVGQNYDIGGSLNTHVSKSNLYRDIEHCTITVARRECYYINGKYRCRTVYVNYPGRRMVEYYYQDKKQSIELNILPAGDDVILAQFLGHENTRERIQTYSGVCSY